MAQCKVVSSSSVREVRARLSCLFSASLLCPPSSDLMGSTPFLEVFNFIYKKNSNRHVISKNDC